MKIFLVEDDKFLNDMLGTTFSSIGYEIVSFDDGKEAFNNLDVQYDLYIIDINLPNVNGLELLKQIKTLNKNANVFIMSADTNIETILDAYNIGCDDYIRKPFDIREVLAKIQNRLDSLPKVIQFTNGCEYIIDERKCIYQGQEIKLTKKEDLLFTILLQNNGRFVSNNEIENYVWGETYQNGHVRQLVAKLRKTLPCELIENHNSNGYRIKKDLLK